MPTDAWGQDVSTDAETAAAYVVLLDRRLRFEPTVVDALRHVLVLDPRFALAHAQAVLLATAGEPALDPRHHLDALREGPEPATDRERSFVAAARLTGEAGPWAAFGSWRRHVDDHPGDLPAVMQLELLLAWSTDPVHTEESRERLERARAVLGEDPTVLAALALHAQDRGDLDTAWALGNRSLELSPDNPVSAHPVAHVHFESGGHDEGLAWLDPLVSRLDPDNVMGRHLGWHCALHLLDLGRSDDALARYESLVSQPSNRLIDGASLLWRCQLAALVPPGTDPAGHGTTTLLATDPGGLPFTFLAMHALLALAAAGDAGRLRRLAHEAAGWEAPGAALLLPGLARGLAASVEGDHADAAGELLALEPWFPRYGGSHAQREVLEDTLLHSLVAAGRVEEARTRLLARLDRRPSGRDAAMLALAQGPVRPAGQRAE